MISGIHFDETSPTELPNTNSIASLQGMSLLKCVDDCNLLGNKSIRDSLTGGLSQVHQDIVFKNIAFALEQDAESIAKKLPKLNPWDDPKIRMLLKGTIDDNCILSKLRSNIDLLQKIINNVFSSSEHAYIQHSVNILSIFPKNECSAKNIQDFGKILIRMGQCLNVISSINDLDLDKSDIRM